MQIIFVHVCMYRACMLYLLRDGLLHLDVFIYLFIRLWFQSFSLLQSTAKHVIYIMRYLAVLVDVAHLFSLYQQKQQYAPFNFCFCHRALPLFLMISLRSRCTLFNQHYNNERGTFVILYEPHEKCILQRMYMCVNPAELYSNKYIMEYLTSLLLIYTGSVFARLR